MEDAKRFCELIKRREDVREEMRGQIAALETGETIKELYNVLLLWLNENRCDRIELPRQIENKEEMQSFPEDGLVVKRLIQTKRTSITPQFITDIVKRALDDSEEEGGQILIRCHDLLDSSMIASQEYVDIVPRNGREDRSLRNSSAERETHVCGFKEALDCEKWDICKYLWDLKTQTKEIQDEGRATLKEVEGELLSLEEDLKSALVAKPMRVLQSNGNDVFLDVVTNKTKTKIGVKTLRSDVLPLITERITGLIQDMRQDVSQSQLYQIVKEVTDTFIETKENSTVQVKKRCKK